jgi:hypothetical protein
MVRVRLTSLALAGGLLFLSGCSMNWDMLRPGSLFHRNCTDCEEVAASPAPGCATGACPGGPLLNSQTIIEGPGLFPPSPSPFAPGTIMPPAAGGQRPNTLPQIVTIPQATPTPSPP